MTRQTHHPIGPGDYWHIGPVYIRKGLFLVLLGAAALLILGIFGLPLSWLNPLSPLPPLYRYNDPALRTLSGTVRIADDAGRVRYIGEVAQGTYTGTGKVYDESGQLCYEGPLVNGVYEGSGAKVYSDGQLIYSGDMVNNQYEGQGRRIDLETGVVSEGQFSRGMLEGEGVQYDADGNLLREGTFSQDLLNGPGKEYSSNGTLLREGTFVQGLLHGDGMEYTQSGLLRYQGQFQRGVYHGSGQLYDTGTQSLLYRGEFVQGIAKGQGQIYHPSGQLLYTGEVYDVQPRADAFLSLSLTEVEQAFSQHWQAYVYGNVTAFVYPYFHLMFGICLLSRSGRRGRRNSLPGDGQNLRAHHPGPLLRAAAARRPPTGLRLRSPAPSIRLGGVVQRLCAGRKAGGGGGRTDRPAGLSFYRRGPRPGGGTGAGRR